MITCPRCGFQAPDGTPYCPRCGYGKPADGAQQPPSGPAPASAARTAVRISNDKQQNQIIRQKRIIVALAALLAFSLIFLIIINSIRSNLKDQLRAAQRTVSAQQTDLRSIRQTATAFASEPTATPTMTPEPTITPTPKGDVPALCKDKQMDLIRLANALDAEGHPYPGDYDPARNSCIYTLSDTSSFLNMNSFGYLSILHDGNDQPYGAIIEIYYKDNAQVRELINDWGSVSLAYLDPDTDIISAGTYIRTAVSSGFAFTDKYAVTAKLDTDLLVYQMGILDMAAVE